MDPMMTVAAAVVGVGLLGLAIEALVSSIRRAGTNGRSPIIVKAAKSSRDKTSAARLVVREPNVERPAPAVKAPEVVVGVSERAEAVAMRPASVVKAPAEGASVTDHAPPAKQAGQKDPLTEQRRFFLTLGTALMGGDETAPATLAALQANLTADVFTERMTMAMKSWRPDGFGTGGRELRLKADGTPPDIVVTKVIEGYEKLKLGFVREAMNAFLAGIEVAKNAAAEDLKNPWPHAWSAFAWRGLALIAEESGDDQAAMAGLKVAYQSMVNAFEISTK